MEETHDTRKILHELKAIRKELHFLKEHIVDSDLVLTEDDERALVEAAEDRKAGRAKRIA